LTCSAEPIFPFVRFLLHGLFHFLLSYQVGIFIVPFHFAFPLLRCIVSLFRIFLRLGRSKNARAGFFVFYAPLVYNSFLGQIFYGCCMRMSLTLVFFILFFIFIIFIFSLPIFDLGFLILYIFSLVYVCHHKNSRKRKDVPLYTHYCS